MKASIFSWKFTRRDEFLILLLSLLFRLFSLFYSGGFLHSDEIFQTVEQAHRIRYGYGIKPLEFRSEEYRDVIDWSWGERSYFLPFLLSFFDFLNPFGYSTLWFRLVVSLFSALIPFLVYKIGLEIYGREVALFSGLVATFWWDLLYFSSRTLSTPFATPFLFLSIYFALKKKVNPFLSGIFLGIAFMIRFAVLVAFLPLLLFFKKGKSGLLSGFLLMLLLQGLIDAVTWGEFLHSPLEFIRFNFFGKGAELFGVKPFHYYLVALLDHLGPLFLVALPYSLYASVFGRYREKLLCDILFLSLLLFSCVAHKEFRFIFFLVPILLLFFSKGLYALLRKFSLRKEYFKLVFFVFIISFWLGSKFNWSPKKDLCSAMEFVGKQDDLKSLLIFETWSETCGYFCLHKNVPIYFFPAQADWTPEINEVKNLTYLRQLIREEVNYVICTGEKSQSILDFEGEAGLDVLELCLNETSLHFAEFKRFGRAIILKRK